MRLSVLVVLAAFGCGTGGTGAGPDAGGAGADAAPRCPDPTSALPQSWRPIATVSAGEIENAAAGSIVATTVDATAGGFGGSADEPFVYVDLSSGLAAKVDIDDVTSYGSTDWDLAFKRHVIRANGGDSGPGEVAVSRVTASSLEEVTAAPADSTFATDTFASPSCGFLNDDIGAPLTVFSDWYDLDNMILTPRAFVYVVRPRSGTLVKLEIETYYGDPAAPERSAVFRVRWAPL